MQQHSAEKMLSLPIRGADCFPCCALRPGRGIFGPHLRDLRSICRSISAVRRLPTYASQSAPFEVEVLPGPSSGTYRSRRTMSEREVRRSPFIIGVAGGTASGKTSVCKSPTPAPARAIATLWRCYSRCRDTRRSQVQLHMIEGLM